VNRIMLAMAIVGLSACEGSPQAIFSCELSTVSQCTQAKLEYDCLFTNNSQVRVNTLQFKTWFYDSSDVLINHSDLSSQQVPPGQTVHVQFIRIDNGKASTIRICSVDPQSSLGKSLPMTRIN